MRVTVWSDYCCPWCYLALDREQLLVDLGVEVTVLPFELHPHTPPGGRPLAAGYFDRVAAECEEAGLPFRTPARTPNTRMVLAAAEHVRRTSPAAFAPLHRSLLEAHFVDGLDLGDPDVVDDLVMAAGATKGRDDAAVVASMAEATGHGVTATPAFLFDTGLLVPGVQPRASLARWVERMQR